LQIIRIFGIILNMNDTFSTILNKHESDDKRQADTEKLFLAAIKNEFANSEEIFDAVEQSNLSVRDFLAGRVKEFPVLPIRQSDNFYIKKHTESQMPYFHSHTFYELIYVHRGKCVQRFNDGTELLLTAGGCLLVFPSCVHKIEKCNSSDIILKFVIPANIFDSTGGRIIENCVGRSKILFENVTESAEFAILKLLQEQSSKNKYNNLLIQSYLTIIFAELADTNKTDIAIETKLDEYFGENIKMASLADFAAKQNYNSDYIGRLIKNKTGKSFSELFAAYRIARAKQLLVESNLTIENIAYEIGYSNTSGFYKQFFSVVGIKPNEYRNLLK